MVVFFDGLGNEGSHIMICNECETVSYCTKHGCIPKQPAQPAAWETEMRAELAKLGFDGQCPESIGITLKGWFDAYAKSLAAPAQPALVQDEVAYLFTNVQSGDIESSTDPDYKQDEREMWYREPLVRPLAAPVAMRIPKVGDRVVCIDDESLGAVVYLTAGGSPEIRFDDGSHGTYMLREFAELFGYTTPPAAQPAAQEFVCSTGLCHYKEQRQWVGLVESEKADLWKRDTAIPFSYADAIEAKLKEKNTC
jgi:hypothetical protein